MDQSMSVHAPKVDGEKVPLISKMQETFYEAYSTECHCTMENGVVTDYAPYKLASLRALCSAKGTVLMDPVLFVEQIIYSLIFFGVGVPLYILQSRSAGLVHKDTQGAVFDKLSEQEDLMRKFSLILTMLAAFLLSLYTSIMVGRWWTIRTHGVGAIKAAAVELVLYISQFVTNEDEILSAINRNARASLKLIFLWRRGQLANEDKMKEELVTRNQILTEDELEQLLSPGWNHNLYESIWAWNVSIVQTLYEEGLIKSDQLLIFLLQRCSDGRAGVQCIATHLSVKVPMSYVHLLGFIVKIHNLICAIIMGILFSVAYKERNAIVCFQLFGRTLLMPFLFNAILLINAELADPFDGGSGDFPIDKYDKGLTADGHSFIEAGRSLPPWLEARKAKSLSLPPKLAGTGFFSKK